MNLEEQIKCPPSEKSLCNNRPSKPILPAHEDSRFLDSAVKPADQHEMLPQLITEEQSQPKMMKTEYPEQPTFSDKLIESSKVQKKPKAKVSRKPKLKYRPEKASIVELNDINIDKPLLPQLQSASGELLSNLYFLHYALAKCQKTVFVSGAGMSVAAGIPDFRSSNGLFQGGLSIEKHNRKPDKAQGNDKTAESGSDTNTSCNEEERRYSKREIKQRFSLASSKELFTSNVYSDSTLTGSFHQLVLKLLDIINKTQPTKFHNFVNSISKEGRLLRLYTQNIDCLDAELPHLQTVTPLKKCLPKKNKGKSSEPTQASTKLNIFPKTIQLHGSLKTMCCSKCHWITETNPSVFRLPTPIECPECQELNSVRSIVGKRTQSSGIIRPRFVLYNEFHPDGEVIGQIIEHDLKKCKPDCLVVVGTSLKIPGVRRLVREMSNTIKLGSTRNNGCVLWINLEQPSTADINFFKGLDLIVSGDCQKVPDIIRKIDAENIFDLPQIKKRIGQVGLNSLYASSSDKNPQGKVTKPVNRQRKKVQSRIVTDKDGKLVNYIVGKSLNMLQQQPETKK